MVNGEFLVWYQFLAELAQTSVFVLQITVSTALSIRLFFALDETMVLFFINSVLLFNTRCEPREIQQKSKQ